MNLFCPINSDSSHDVRTSGAFVTASGYQNGYPGTKTFFQACRVYGAGNGGACGTFVFAPTNNSVYNVIVTGDTPTNAPAWKGGASIDGFLLIPHLPPTYQGSSSTFFSYYLGLP
jgi:hypothetical protein